MNTSNSNNGVDSWLERFAECVRTRNIESGKTLFDPRVRSFGTRIEWTDDLESLAEDQWRPIWFSTTEFQFLPKSIVTIPSADATQMVVLARWRSTGQSEEREPFPRCGRCTLVLRRDSEHPTGWRAIHTHFSLWKESN